MLYRLSSASRCFHKQGIITAQISYITREVEQTNGKENVIIRWYSQIFWESLEQLGVNGSPVSVRNYSQCERSCKTVGAKDSRNIEEYFEVFCNHKRATGNEGTNSKDV